MEDIVLKSLFNKEYSKEVFSFLRSDFFEGVDKTIFNIYANVLTKYGKIPNKDVYEIELNKVNLSEDARKEVNEKLDDIFAVPVEVDNLKYLVDKTEEWGLQRSVHNAIVTGITEFEKDKPDFSGTYNELRQAIGYSFDRNIGLTYISDAEKRFELYQEVNAKHTTGIGFLDSQTDGGTEDGTLNIVIGESGSGKSIDLCHKAATHIALGKNVLYVSLEMAEKNIHKRIDANLMNLPIWEIGKMTKDNFMKRTEVIRKSVQGELVVKQYPPRSITALNIRHLIEELKLKKGFMPDVICVDYLGIIGSSLAPRGANSYVTLQFAAEELRALAIEYNLPLFTGGQVNRSGYGNSAMGMDNIADSMGIVHTADLIYGIMVTEELEENNQALCTILKNRFGPVGVSDIVGLDKPRMKFYDCVSNHDSSGSTSKNAEKKLNQPPEKDKKDKKIDKSNFSFG